MKVMLPCTPQSAVSSQQAMLPQELTPTSTAMMFPPGLSAPPGTPSHGSTLHDSGSCRPCAWFWKPSGCQNGQNCGHCHLCPEGELKTRKKNKVVMMRLGLATPKPVSNMVDLTPFFPLEQSSSEQDSTTCCSSPEQDSLAPPSGSDEEEILSSVIGCLGLEEADDAPNVSMRSTELFPSGSKAPPNTPSHGSAAHMAGNCKPCAWFWKPSGCQNAQDCAYCHICSEGELKSRKKSKHTAMRLGLVTPKANPTPEQEARYALNLAACV